MVMARDSRAGTCTTDARTGASATASSAACACADAGACARAFVACPSFHTLRVRRVLSLVIVRVDPILYLRRVPHRLARENRGAGEGKGDTYVREDNVHVFGICGMCVERVCCAGLCFGRGGRCYTHTHVFFCLGLFLVHPGHILWIHRAIFLEQTREMKMKEKKE
jgi:hypothetical protein